MNLSSLFYSVVLAGIACGLLLPGIGQYSHQIPLMVGIMLFCNFLEVKVALHRLLRRELLATFLLSAVFMPLFVYYIMAAGVQDPYRTGLLLIACAPTGITSTVLGRQIRGSDSDLIFGNFFFLTLGSIFYIPAVLEFLLGASREIRMVPIILDTAMLVLIPYFASWPVLTYLLPRWPTWTKQIPRGLVLLMLFLVIATSISVAARDIEWNRDLLTLSVLILGIYLLQGGLGYLAGWLVGGKGVRNTVAFISSSRNPQIVLAVAILNFTPLTVFPILLAVFFHHLTNVFWLWLFRRG